MGLIQGSYPLPVMTLTGAGSRYFHVKGNSSGLVSIGGLTLSIPTGVVVNIDITHNPDVADATLAESEWVRVGTSITAQEFPYKTGSCMGFRITWVSGTTAGTPGIRGEATEFSGGGGGTASSPSIVSLSGLLEGEDQAYHRMATFNKLNYWTRISSATTTPVRTGVNTLVRLVVEQDTVGITTFYDAVTATGTPPLILPVGFKAGVYQLDLPLSVGLTIVTAGADRLCVGGIYPV